VPPRIFFVVTTLSAIPEDRAVEAARRELLAVGALELVAE
jgi:hypothetical protein